VKAKELEMQKLAEEIEKKQNEAIRETQEKEMKVMESEI
jgi:hypothetical protein